MEPFDWSGIMVNPYTPGHRGHIRRPIDLPESIWARVDTDPFASFREVMLRVMEAREPGVRDIVLPNVNRSSPCLEAEVKDWLDRSIGESNWEVLIWIFTLGDTADPVFRAVLKRRFSADPQNSDGTFDKELAYWIDRSERDADAWMCVQRFLCFLRDDNSHIPSVLDEWAKDVACGKRKEPRRRRGDRRGSPNVQRDWALNMAIAKLVSEGFPATQTEATAAEPESACHIVARARGMKYETVASVWKARRRRLLREQLSQK